MTMLEMKPIKTNCQTMLYNSRRDQVDVEHGVETIELWRKAIKLCIINTALLVIANNVAVRHTGK